jgi:phosphate transport system substrate-binding protein
MKTTAKIPSRNLLGVMLCALACLVLAAHEAHAQTVKLGGTGSGLGTMKVLGEAFAKTNPGFTLTIASNLGSSGGLKALVAGAIDVAVTSRAVKPEEAAQGVVAVEYGRTPFVLGTRNKSVSNLTLAHAADIVAGRVDAWPDGSRIRLVLRPASDIDTSLLAAFSPAMQEAVRIAHRREARKLRRTPRSASSGLWSRRKARRS